MSTWGCGECGTRYAVGAPRCPQCKANKPITEQPSSPLASLTVACLPADSGCRHGGVMRRVMLPQIVPGVIDMPDLRCAGCGGHLANVPKEEPQDMPKITAHGGPTNAADTFEEESSPTPEAPGTSSSTSSEKEPNSPKTSEPVAPSPARTTANRSKKARTGSSSAGSTAGDPTAPTSDDD